MPSNHAKEDAKNGLSRLKDWQDDPSNVEDRLGNHGEQSRQGSLSHQGRAAWATALWIVG